jgi:hypothetical protein|tara:strand:- start:558 stop:779 length:222 start_codon:yes stop_codon:yes gene_type:complete
MKNKLKLNINLNSPSRKTVKTPIVLRKRDYSPMPIDSPKSIKHRVSVIEIEVSNEINKKKEEKEEEEEKYNHK